MEIRDANRGYIFMSEKHMTNYKNKYKFSKWPPLVTAIEVSEKFVFVHNCITLCYIVFHCIGFHYVAQLLQSVRFMYVNCIFYFYWRLFFLPIIYFPLSNLPNVVNLFRVRPYSPTFGLTVRKISNYAQTHFEYRYSIVPE